MKAEGDFNEPLVIALSAKTGSESEAQRRMVQVKM
jgi:hypothetical protein